jgi:CBS domain containing-hemolysin-like protein
MDTAFIIIAMLAMMIFAYAFYVAAEFATMNANRNRIIQKAASGNQFAKFLEAIVTDTNRLDIYVTACQLGTTISSLALGFYTQSVIASHFSPILLSLHETLQSPWYVEPIIGLVLIGALILALTMVHVILGELLPRSLALRYPEDVALFMIMPLRWSMALFRPAIALFNRTAALVLRLLHVSPAPHRQILSPEEIELLAMESARMGLLEADEHQLLHNVFRAGELTAVKVMVPRTRLVAASVDTPFHTLLEQATTSGHSRLLLYRDTIDDIVGSVHLKDLFRLHTERSTNIRSILRRVSYVPESQPALAVWKQLQKENSYVTIVLDEFGGTKGMITIADLIEEIFGELRDEFDHEPSLVDQGLDGCIRLQGDVLIADVNEWFDLKLPDEEVNTIGGLVMSTLGRLPQVGDEVSFGAVMLRVEQIKGPGVTEVCLYNPPSHEPDDPSNRILTPDTYGEPE